MLAAKRWTIAAGFIALVPIGFFVLFAANEGAGGAGHYLQAAPVAALAALGWWRPREAGWGLLALAILFAILYATRVGAAQLVPTVAVGLIFFIPLLLAGTLLLRAHHAGE